MLRIKAEEAQRAGYCEVCNDEPAVVGDLQTRLTVCMSCFETLNDLFNETEVTEYA